MLQLLEIELLIACDLSLQLKRMFRFGGFECDRSTVGKSINRVIGPRYSTDNLISISLLRQQEFFPRERVRALSNRP